MKTTGLAFATPRRRFTVDEYHRMGETGILGTDVELIAGEIVVRKPISSYHADTVTRLNWLWASRLHHRAVVQALSPVELAEEDSEPQPDVTLLRPRADFYTMVLPVAADVFLLVEVADSVLVPDRRARIPLYGRAGIRESWLVDLTSGRVEVYRDLVGGRYRAPRIVGREESIVPEAFPDLSIAVVDVVG